MVRVFTVIYFKHKLEPIIPMNRLALEISLLVSLGFNLLAIVTGKLKSQRIGTKLVFRYHLLHEDQMQQAKKSDKECQLE